MLIYHGESDSFFWDENFDFDAGADAALCIDATEILWAVVVARDRGIVIPDVERHLQYLRDIGCDDDLPIHDDDNPYWSGL
jgi:hypothetical protein